MDGVTLATSPGATLTGFVLSDSGEVPDFKPSQLQIAARAADPSAGGPGFGGGGGARVGDDWTFTLGNITDAVYLRTNAPQGWVLRSVLVNGEDIIFPTPQRDCARAVQYLRYHAKDYNIDLSRLVVGGNSAGGQLSLMAAMARTTIRKPAVQRWVNRGGGSLMIGAGLLAVGWHKAAG